VAFSLTAGGFERSDFGGFFSTAGWSSLARRAGFSQPDTGGA